MIKYKTDSLEIDEIVYCDITVEIISKKGKLDTKELKTFKKVVYKEEDGHHKGNKVIDLSIRSRLGFAMKKNLGYTKVQKSEEVRNNITGAYE